MYSDVRLWYYDNVLMCLLLKEILYKQKSYKTLDTNKECKSLFLNRNVIVQKSCVGGKKKRVIISCDAWFGAKKSNLQKENKWFQKDFCKHNFSTE